MEKFISFKNHGQRIVGMTRAPALLICHGFTGDKVENHFIFVKMARRLADAGFFAMRFDFRGSGESEGDFSDMTVPAEIDDARVALAHRGINKRQARLKSRLRQEVRLNGLGISAENSFSGLAFIYAQVY